MDDVFEEENSAVLSSHSDKDYNISFDCHTPRPLLSSTVEKHIRTGRLPDALQNPDSRGSYISGDKLTYDAVRSKSENCSPTGSSVGSKCGALSVRDSSSLSVLELPDLSDVGKAESLVFLNSKNNSIGSWLDHCFSCDEADHTQTGDHQLPEAAPQNQQDVLDTGLPRVETVGTPANSISAASQALETKYKDGNDFKTPGTRTHFDTDRSFDSEFEFDEDELDLEGLINEVDVEGDLDNTIQAEEGQNPKICPLGDAGKDLGQSPSSSTITDMHESNSTTYGFLRNLGFPVSTPSTLDTLKTSAVEENDSQNTSRLDSRYLAAAHLDSMNDSSKYETSLSTSIHNMSGMYNDKSDVLAFHSLQPISQKDSETAIPKAQKRPTVDCDNFDDWQNGPVLNFSGIEFKADCNLQQQMLGDDAFSATCNVDDMLNAEEESFKKEHQFSMNDNFDAACGADDLKDFSICRTSAITVSDADSGKMSIGTYMAKRSEKLGGLSSDQVTERPTFGLEWQTPSPQKPCMLIKESDVGAKGEDASEESLMHDETQGQTSADISQLPMLLSDETVDKSMMTVLSNALSNISGNMNNDELAKFIVALSNKKLEYQKQKKAGNVTCVSKSAELCKYDKSDAVDDDTKTTELCVNTSSDAKRPEQDSITSKVVQQLVRNNHAECAHKASLLTQHSQTLQFQLPLLPDGDVSSGALDAHPGIQTELPSITGNETLFSPELANSNFFSSTQANLSLTRGSISRESIEELHRKLRLKVDQLGDGSSALPDVVFPQIASSGSLSSAAEHKPKIEMVTAGSKDDKKLPVTGGKTHDSDAFNQVSVFPLSQSSPEKTDTSKQVTANDTTSRFSTTFQQLLPSITFNEMATVPESEFDARHLPSCSRLETIKECEESMKSGRSSLDSVKSKQGTSNYLATKAPPKASSTAYDVDLTQSSSNSSTVSSGISSVVPHGLVAQPWNSCELVKSGERPVEQSCYNRYPPPLAHGDPQLYHRMLTASSFSQLVAPTVPSTFVGPRYPNRSQTFDSTLYPVQSHYDFTYPTATTFHAYPSSSIAQGSQNPSAYLTQTRCYDAISHALSVPADVQFDKVLCVDVPASITLPVKNNSPRWMQVEVYPISSSINGQCGYVPVENCVSMKKKHVIGPHKIEDIGITFTGSDAGRYHVILQIVCDFISMEATQTQHHASTVNIHATVEMPSVSLFGLSQLPSDSRQTSLIDFGEVASGTVKSLPLRISNESKAETPMRLVMYTSFHDRKCFSLSSSPVPTVSSDSDYSGVQVLPIILPVSSQPKIVWIHFQTSLQQFSAGEKPEKVEGRIEAVLDTLLKQPVVSSNSSQIQTALDTIAVAAVLGTCKLHAPRCQQTICFSAYKGSKQTKSFPVKNVGNISAHIEFSVASHKEYFSVHPLSTILPPGGDVELIVDFSVLDVDLRTPVSSLILMKISPSGPQFEVKLKGFMIKSPPNQATVPKIPSCFLTNKTLLRWGGVVIGQSMKKALMLRSGQSETFAFRASIKEDKTSSFQIATIESGCEELSTVCDMMMTPSKDKTINVLFAPSKHKLVHAKLELKTPIDDLPASKYTIPLSGYGGTSQIIIEGLDRKKTALSANQNDHKFCTYVTELNEPCAKKKFVMRNTGSRTAFVKMVAYSDNLCKHISSDFLCNPSQIVVPAGKSLSIGINCMKEHHLNSPSFAYICVWYGDELLRQLMKKALSAQPSSLVKYLPKTATHLQSVSFYGKFDGEEHFLEEDISDHKPHSVDVQLFYANLQQSIIETTLCQRPPDVLPVSDSKKPERDLSVLPAQLLAKVKTPSSVSSMTSSAHVNLQSSSQANWHVTPTHITLEVPSLKVSPEQVAEPNRVKIVNKSMASLVFDVVWPGHYLTVTPSRGRVEAESVTVLLISANPSVASRKDELPWCGQVMIVASAYGLPDKSDNVRVIRVQIKDGVKAVASARSSVTSGVVSHDSRSSSPSVSLESFLRVTSSIIDFDDVAVGAGAKSLLEFRNMFKFDIKWVLTSFAPPYVKNVDSSGDLFRSSYAAFIFSHTSGKLEAGACVQVPVTFNPMNAGLYTQHWEIEYHGVTDSSALLLQREKISLQGHCTTARSKPRSNEMTMRPSPKNEICVTWDSFTFEQTSVGKLSIAKIPIKNKSKHARTVKFIGIHPPFYTTRLQYTIKSMHCANLPVTFKPTNAGSYIGSLIIQTETSDSIHITLKATAV